MAHRPVDAEARERQLRLAAKTVDDHLGREQKYPELSDFFSTDGSSNYVAPDARQQILRRKRAINLPDNLFEQYNLIQCRCFMGLFPEINRVWITIDHRLFLWNYADGGHYESYEELDQIIVNVALVKPKKDTFDSKVEYLLVIATPVDVHLLGLGAGSGSNPHTLYITNMSVPSDNVAMRSIVGTNDGRIFMNGSDGRLWEIEYQAEEGWFSKKCSKREVIGSPLSYFVPTFLSKIKVDPIVKIVFDESRQVMYGLTENSNIEVISLINTVSPRSTIKRGTILQEARRKNEGRALDDTLKIVDIHFISTKESRDICLVAITSAGCRLYFSNKPPMSYYNQQDQPNATSLHLVQVRLPPTFDAVPAGALGSNGQYQVHQSLYHNGIFLAAHALSDSADALIASAPDSGPINRDSSEPKALGTSYIPRLTETAMITAVEGKIWGMTEAPSVNFAGPIDSSIIRNELAVQFSQSPREYLVLTNSGVNVFTKRRPVDILQQLLLEGRAAEAEVKGFFNSYGRVETCAMCIAILSGHPSLSTASGSQYVGPLSANAERWLLEQGGEREATQRVNNERITTNGLIGTELGRPVAQSSAGHFTYRHTAFSLYLARLLRPIWKRKVVKVTNPARQLVDTEISETVLTAVQTTLFSLSSFLNEHAELFTRRFVATSNPPSESDQIELENVEEEMKSMRALQLLLTQSIEGIAFVLFLVDSKMSETVSNIPAESQQALLNMTYENLLTTAKGHDLCRELVTAVINKQMGHHMSVDAVSDTLQRICGSFCNPSDVIYYQATEHIRLAKSFKNPADVEDSLREALRLFKKVPFLLVDETHGPNKLRVVCKDFTDLGFPSGAVELALSCAHDVDPSNKATGFHMDCMNPKDVRGEQYSQRMRCYDNVAMVLAGLKLDSAHGAPSEAAVESISTALRFEDNLFHTYLYDWLLSHGRTDYLLEIASPYIVQFLQECTKINEHKDLLWQYYTKMNDFGLAAKELGRIANSPHYNLTVYQRLEYLSLAVSNAKSFPAGSDSMTENGRLLVELEESQEVGNIQLDIILSLEAKLDQLKRKMNNVMSSNSSREEAREEAQEVGNMLNLCQGQLMTVNGLYYEIVEPLKMYGAMLAIYHTSELDDEYHVRAAWEGFISKVFDEAVAAGRPPLTDIEVRVKEVGRRYYPSATVTPIKTMVQILERYPYLKQVGRHPSPLGWAVRILREIGFPYEALFDTFHSLIETKVKEWMAPRATLVLIQDIEFLLRVWLAESHGSRVISELNDELGIVEDEWLAYGSSTSLNAVGKTSPLLMGASNGVLGGSGSGALDRFRTRKVEEAIQTYIRMLESASWTPTAISGPFDETMGGSKAELEVKAANLVRRLQAIRNRIQRIN
ncbi:hypothetical protein BGZ94_008391 [Podila epigama]|nr:hypothetical protein BGZ94_008391 [Podila epigama]